MMAKQSTLWICTFIGILLSNRAERTSGDRHDLAVKVARNTTATVDQIPSTVSQVMTEPCLLYRKESLMVDSTSGELIPGESVWECEASSEDQVSFLCLFF